MLTGRANCLQEDPLRSSELNSVRFAGELGKKRGGVHHAPGARVWHGSCAGGGEANSNRSHAYTWARPIRQRVSHVPAIRTQRTAARAVVTAVCREMRIWWNGSQSHILDWTAMVKW